MPLTCRNNGQRRSGFTLIEMLVVIAIITVLVALVVPAVMYFTRKGPPLLTTNEISQLDTAIQNFKTTYKVDYIPSRLRLCENISDYTLSINPATGQPFVTLTTAQNNSINNGRTVFGDVVHCDSCHVPSVTLNGRIWQEPSDNANYRDATFPAGQSPTSRGVSPTNAIRVDITRHGPDNRFVIPGTNGDLLGSFRRNGNGATVTAFTDYRRHNLGFEVAEQIDEEGTGASTFMTRSLWGIGSTGPYMHNGSATTLTEAILLHGGDAASSRSQFLALSGSSTGRQQQADLIAYLNEHVLFTTE